MDIDNKNQTFKTTDLTQAATLKALGFKMESLGKEINYNSGRILSSFIFTQTEPLMKILEDYDREEIRVIPQLLFYYYRELTKQIKAVS
jgi:hypothetical protein